jgi:hypothetical protein
MRLVGEPTTTPEVGKLYQLLGDDVAELVCKENGRLRFKLIARGNHHRHDWGIDEEGLIIFWAEHEWQEVRYDLEEGYFKI